MVSAGFRHCKFQDEEGAATILVAAPSSQLGGGFVEIVEVVDGFVVLNPAQSCIDDNP